MQIFLLLFGSLCCTQIAQILGQDETEITKTFELLEERNKKVELTNETDVVLVFGATGSGKSTLIQWITHDSALFSKETSPDSGSYLIEDTNDKIGSSSVSKTLYPELVVDTSTETAFYDLPGFSDTRSPCYDIAASFFMKTVMDHVKNVKMLFMVNYFSVKEGEDKVGFRSLLKNINDLIMDLDKYNNSMALVVSKVDNNYIKVKGKLVPKPDSKVIEEVATFLQKIQKDFEDDLMKPGISSKQQSFSRNAIRVINIFLTKENGEYTRIALFRKPDEEGPLSENELLTEEKFVVKNLISENLNFADTEPNDFGFTISDTSKLEISSLAAMIDEKMTGNIAEIAVDVKKRLETFVEPVRLKLSGGNHEALTLAEATDFAAQAENGNEIISEAVHYFAHLQKATGMWGMIKIYLSNLNMEVSTLREDNMEKLSEYFEFFQLFNENPLPISSLAWANSFQTALSYLAESKQFIRSKASSLAEEINSQITFDVEVIANLIKANFTDDVNRMTELIVMLRNDSSFVKGNRLEAREFSEKLQIREEILTKLVENIKVMPSPQMLSGEITETLVTLSLELPYNELSNVAKKSQELTVLQKISDTNLSLPTGQWSNSFKSVVTYLQTQNILTHVKYSEETIELNVDFLLKTIFDKMQSTVDQTTNQIGIKEIDDDLEKYRSQFASILEKLKTKITLREWILVIDSSLSNLNDVDIRSSLESLVQQEKYLGFLKSLRGDESDVLITTSWKAHGTDFTDYLNFTVNFHYFVTELYKALSQFEVQKDVSIYDVLDLSGWRKPRQEQGVHIDINNFKLFMEKVKVFKIKAAEEVRDFIPTESQLKILNIALTNALKKRVIVECPNEPNSMVTLRANFIKFSDFLDPYGRFKRCGWKDVSSLEIYALETLFIDQDLNALDHKLKLSIIASKWEIIGNRRIVLDGRDGESLPKASRDWLTSDGDDGSPGLAGGSAGAFFGVAGSMVNGDHLIISANGGKGGRGQSGGDGSNGQDGKTPDEIETCDLEAYYGFQIWVNDVCRVYPCEGNRGEVYGQLASRGGNAGSCGIGGQGGLKGEILFTSLTKTSTPVKIAIDGAQGINGVPGEAGHGGSHGDDRIVVCKDIGESKNKGFWGGAFAGGVLGAVTAGPPGAAFGAVAGSLSGYLLGNLKESVNPSLKFSYSHLAPKGSAEHGVPSYGCNSKLPEHPLPARDIQNVSTYLRNFRRVLVENYNERFVGLVARQNIELLNTNPEIRNLLE